jgi:hypothetical protein
MGFERRPIDALDLVIKMGKAALPLIRSNCKPQEMYEAMLDVIAAAPAVSVEQKWTPVSDPPKKSGRYLIYTTKYFVPDHIGDPDHIDGMEISGYHPQFGFLSDNGLHAKYWSYLPTEPKEVNTDGCNRNS